MLLVEPAESLLEGLTALAACPKDILPILRRVALKAHSPGYKDVAFNLNQFTILLDDQPRAPVALEAAFRAHAALGPDCPTLGTTDWLWINAIP